MVSGGEAREDDRWTESSRDEWMDESENSGFWDNSMCMAMIGFMLPPPTLHRNQYLYNCSTPSEEVTHQFYKQLYTNIIRDIDVSSVHTIISKL